MDPVFIMLAINLLVNLFALVSIYIRIIVRLTKVETNLEHLMHASGLHVRKTESLRSNGNG